MVEYSSYGQTHMITTFTPDLWAFILQGALFKDRGKSALVAHIKKQEMHISFRSENVNSRRHLRRCY
jgi:hypothetical protein